MIILWAMRMQEFDDTARAGLRVVPGDADPPWHGIPTAIARRFHQMCAARTSEVVGEFDLTPLQFGVMVHLSRITGKEGIEQNVLADRVNVDRNTASLVVEQLVKMGIVARQVDEADRRVRLVSLTPKGRKLHARLRPALIALNEDILSPITFRERKLLMELLIRVIEENLRHPKGTRHQGKRGRRQSPVTMA
jgi:DNA-binding MarR family transcriptional regulator